MRTAAIILLILALSCKKKEQPPPFEPTPPAPTTTTGTPGPVDTIPRVLKSYKFYLKTYCNYKGTVTIYLDDKEAGPPWDSTYYFQTKDTMTKLRGTKMRYFRYGFHSFKDIQLPNGNHMDCETDFTLWINGVQRTTYSKVYYDGQGYDLYE